MNNSEYEDYVAVVVESLTFGQTARIFRNRRYQGIRQPGVYEIDIACEFWIDDALFFITIVECKHWKRPVDRPQIQKLIQTRDAIGAHKCAFALPVGYTSEAIEVAKAHGVALWVIAQGILSVAAGGGLSALATCELMADCLRNTIYTAIGYNRRFLARIREAIPTLVPYHWMRSDLDGPLGAFFAESPFELIYDPCLRHPIEAVLSSDPAANSLTRRAHALVEDFREILRTSGLSYDHAGRFVTAFVLPMVTLGLSVPKLFEHLASFDKTVDHRSIGLIGNRQWFHEHGTRFFLYTDTSASPIVRLENNTAWANAVWKLTDKGYLDSEGNIRL